MSSKKNGVESKPRKPRTKSDKSAGNITDTEKSALSKAFGERWIEIDGRAREANEERKALIAEANAVGFTKDQIKETAALLVAFDEAAPALQARIGQLVDVCMMRGVDLQHQFNFMRAPMQPKDDPMAAFKDGQAAARRDRPRRPPRKLNADDQGLWTRGFDQARVEMNAERAEGFKPLADVVGDALPNLGLGSEEATQNQTGA